MERLEWNDLQIILAVARGGSLSEAAATLGSSHPTVFRRVRAIESALGMTLFERSRQGYRPTQAARDLLALASDVDRRLHEIATAGSRHRVALTTSETLMAGVLPPILAAIRHRLPDVLFDVQVGDDLVDVERRAADIALRAGGTPSEAMIGREICPIDVAIYRPAAWDAVGEDALHRHPWVMPDASFDHLASSRWLAAEGLAARAVARFNSTVAVLRAAESGMGLAILPCYLGDASTQLARVSGCLADFRSTLWLLSPVQLRGVDHIRTILDDMSERLRALSPLFEGRTARSRAA